MSNKKLKTPKFRELQKNGIKY